MPEDRRSRQGAPVQIDGPRAIGALAARQHGVVGRRQLLAAGVTRSMIEERLAGGYLLPVHRGIYAVGHAVLRREGWWTAAVLAAGPGAALSHRSAAALHGIVPSGPARIEVSTSGKACGTKKVRIHSRRLLDAQDVMESGGIRVTTPGRTLVDLAEVLTHARLVKVLGETERLGLFDLDGIEEALRRLRGRRGAGNARMRAALAELAALGITLTRSELEDRFLALLDAHDLPRPRTNARVGPYEVDALWPTARLAVELDGYAHHHGRDAFRRDRRKANDLADAGYQMRRFTHEDLVRRPTDVARRIRRALAGPR